MEDKHDLLLAAIAKADAVNKWGVESMTDKAASACVVRGLVSSILNAEREVCALMAEDYADAIESGTANGDPTSICNAIAGGIRTRVKSSFSLLSGTEDPNN